MMRNKLSTIFIFCLFVIIPNSYALNISNLSHADFLEGKQLGKLKNKALKEVSGITRSTINKDIFWVINDGGDKPFIYAIDRAGKHLGRFFINNTDNRDWEDISSFIKDGKHFLIIADTGDNHAKHKDSFLWIVEEPSLKSHKKKKLNTIDIKQRIRFRYQDGPRDCEAIAVDINKNRILLLSKRTVPAEMYQLPLTPDPKKRMLIAKSIAKLSNIPQPDFSFILTNPFFGLFASQPTAMDISPDGKQLAVLTYNYGYLYELKNKQQWEEVLVQNPLVFEIPELKQAEALSFDELGNIIITSEKKSAPIYIIEKKSVTAQTTNQKYN